MLLDANQHVKTTVEHKSNGLRTRFEYGRYLPYDVIKLVIENKKTTS